VRWASNIATASGLDDALAATLEAIGEDVPHPDLVFAYVSAHHRTGLSAVGPVVRDRFPGARVVGCTGGGVIGAGREIEEGPALSLTAASLPGVRIDARPVASATALAPPAAGEVPRGLIVLAEPFSCDIGALIGATDALHPWCPKVGGVASGGRKRGQTALVLDDTVIESGAVVVSLAGNIRMDAIVAQGCRPVGQPMFVTRAEGHLLLGLDGTPALEALEALVKSLPPEDRQLAKTSLFLGLVMDPTRQSYARGDFLVRNLVGADPARGGIAVAAHPKPNTVVQFHLRDARTSADDLDALLAVHRESKPVPAGALMFSCLGRGQGLYGEPDHDARMIRQHLGPVPLGGFFCNGEIGPVQDRTWLHGYTSAVALFRGSSS